MSIKQNALRDIWEVKDAKWEVKEDYLNESHNKSVVDGKNILAVVEGVFFVPDGLSRNERFYPRDFWENVLKRQDIRERLDSKTMFGCLGHEDRSVSEDDLAIGKVSHIITNLWIDEEGRGMGQAYVLGTQAGKNLYIYMKAGSKIKISSRASGDYKQDEEWNGYPVIDEGSYYLETFDFVINPGFLETDPQIQESVKRIKEEMRGKDTMDEKLVEELEKSRNLFNERLIESEKKNAVFEAEAKRANTELEAVKAKLENFDCVAPSLLEEIKEKSKTGERLTVLTAREVEDLQAKSENLVTVSEELNAYKALGTPDKITEVNESLKKYEEIGTPEEIHETVKLAEATLLKYRELGTPEEIQETLAEVKSVLEAYAELGTYKEVKEIYTTSEKLVKKIKSEQLSDMVLRISKKYGQTVDSVKELVESVGEKQTIKILEGLKKEKPQVAPKAKKPVKSEAKPKADKTSIQNVNESLGVNRYFYRFNKD